MFHNKHWLNLSKPNDRDFIKMCYKILIPSIEDVLLKYVELEVSWWLSGTADIQVPLQPVEERELMVIKVNELQKISW